MKLQIISDLHLEFRDPLFIENVGSDVLILGGDIITAWPLYRHPRERMHEPNNAENRMNAIAYRQFFQHVNDNWKHIIYLMGNHEYYGGKWNRVPDIIREEMQHYPNIHFCDQGRVDIDDVTFLATSLWTDFNGGDPLTALSMKDMMNDYRAITEDRDGNLFHKLRPITTLEKHRSDLDWIKAQLNILQDRKVVISTHHAPSHCSVHPKYAQQTIMNGAFVSNLEHVMLDRPNIKLWTHGHVHDIFDYMVGDTRVFCNPCGVPGERSGWNPDVIIEV